MSWLSKFLKELANTPHLLRPPGAKKEEEFVKRCIKCNKCVQICPYRSIITIPVSYGIKYGTPVIVAREIPCYVCMKCPPVCPTGALDNALTEKENIRMGVAEINSDLCLPYNGVICRACFERCPIYREAITLRDEMYPEVHPEKCIGCGICEHVCPTDEAAIRVVSAHDV
jgi:MauM/NapG family ferredoxin protein